MILMKVVLREDLILLRRRKTRHSLSLKQLISRSKVRPRKIKFLKVLQSGVRIKMCSFKRIRKITLMSREELTDGKMSLYLLQSSQLLRKKSKSISTKWNLRLCKNHKELK